MGAGKSTLGKQLSEALSIPLIDSDAEIEKAAGKTISKLFLDEGETAFRLREQIFVHSLKDKEDFVLAVGGGLPCYNDLINFLNDLGTTIYLKSEPITLVERLKPEREKRPLLHDKNENELADFVNEKLKERVSFYEKAKFIVDDKNQTCDFILHLLHPHQKN